MGSQETEDKSLDEEIIYRGMTPVIRIFLIISMILGALSLILMLFNVSRIFPWGE